MIKAFFFLSEPLVQTRYKEIAINAYKATHIGPNNQFGGAILGLTRVAYHVGIAEIVKKDPNMPAPSQIRNE